MSAAEWTSMLARFVGDLATQAVGYFAFVSLVFVLVWKLGARRLAPRRRAARSGRLAKRQVRNEVTNTLSVLFTGAVNAAVIFALYDSGRTALSTDATQFTWPEVVASFLGLVIINDAWFYAWHRVLHHPRVFRYVHAVHHRSIEVNPFTSYSFHFVETLVLGAWAIPYLMVVPTYVPMLAVLQVVGLANNINAHLGYELYPRWFIRVPPFRWLTSATYHAMHHASARGNYALFFRFWDRAFATECEHYEDRFTERFATSAQRTHLDE